MAYPGGKTESERIKEVMKARPKLFKFHMTAYLVGSALLFGLNLLTTGLSPLWSIWPIAGWGLFAGLHALTYRSSQRQDAKRIQELAGKETVTGSKLSSISSGKHSAGLPEAMRTLQKEFHASLQKLEQAIADLKEENPELNQALRDAQQQGDALFTHLATLYAGIQEEDEDALAAQLATLEEEAAQSSGEAKTLLESRRATLQQRSTSVQQVRQQIAVIEQRLLLLKDQLHALKLDVTTQKAGNDSAKSLEASLRALQTEVKTAQELSALDMRSTQGMREGQ